MDDARRVIPWVLGAAGPADLRTRAAELCARYRADNGERPLDVGYSLASQVTPSPYRGVVVGVTRGDFVRSLDALARGETAPGVVHGPAGEAMRPVFVFPGQGSQWPGMATDLMAVWSPFGAAVRAAAEALAPFTDHSVVDVLRSSAGAGAPTLERVDVVQPALFAVMVALAGLWREFGVEPVAAIGHSIGEPVAAWLTGALSLADSARVMARLSQAQQTLVGQGEMALVSLPVAEVERDLAAEGGRVGIAAVNGPASVVISGDADSVRRVVAGYPARGVWARRIAVGLAAHSSQIERVRDRLLDDLAPVVPRSGRLPFYSGLAGDVLDGSGLTGDHWYRALREPVQFARAARAAHAAHATAAGVAFVEISPHPVLTGSLRDIVDAPDAPGGPTAVLASLRRDQDGPRRFLLSLAEAWVRGVAVDWTVAFAGSGGRLLKDAGRPVGHGDPALIADAVPGDAVPGDAVPGDAVAGTAVAGAAMVGDGSAAAEGPELVRRLAGRSSAQRQRILLAAVRGETASLLGRPSAESVPPGAALREIGLDSVPALELRGRLGELTGLRLAPTLVFDHPTPRALAGHLLAELDGTGEGESWEHATVGTSASAPDGVDDADSAGDGVGGAGSDEPIAILAMSCRLPGGIDDPDALWRLLDDGGEVVGGLPGDRGWDLDQLTAVQPAHHGPNRQREAGFLTGAAAFDAAFFGISPREALAMDPQQRLLLETSWEALERARIDPTSLRGTDTGVFAGVTEQGYGPRLDAAPAELEGFVLTGTTASVASGRVAYVLGLEGPAVSVDTACSSSLVALHLAAQALRRRECSLALAGGVTVMPHPGSFIEFSRKNALSADGRCRAFSADAAGFGLAEGVGVLVLARLSTARRAGHPILALIRGSAVNSDGASNGLTAPNGRSQQRVVRRALAAAGLTPDDIDVVEAHGTGTPLGDPIEATALLTAYGQDRPADRPLWLGSVKSNVGHTQAASGVVGVIKMILAMRHGRLPKTLHVTSPTPHVDWSSGAVRLLTASTGWPATDRPRRAGVSSFGISGTNAHAILEQAPATAVGTATGSARTAAAPDPAAGPDPAAPVVPWLLSGRGEAALAAQARRLRIQVEAGAAGTSPGATPGPALARPRDTGHALATTRAALSHRAVVTAADVDGFRRGLRALETGQPAANLIRGVADIEGDVVFVYPGQGSQWDGMVRDLLADEPGFAACLRECADAIAAHTGWSVLDVVRGEPGAPNLHRVDVLQPVLFAVMVGLTAWWRAHGVEPAAVVGHSQGEIAAACVAGGLSLPDAAKVVCVRARALRATAAGRGGMVSVSLPRDALEAVLGSWPGRLEIAAVNGPGSLVAAGDPQALDELLARCEADGIRARRIQVDYASHTAQVEALRERLHQELADVTPRPATIPFYSSLTGSELDTATLDAGYWYRSLRATVEFQQATEALLTDGHRAFVEISPHPVLTAAVEATAAQADRSVVVVGSLRRDHGGRERLLAGAAELFTRGVAVDVTAAFTDPRGDRPRPVDLPTVAFQRERFWLERPAATRPEAAGDGWRYRVAWRPMPPRPASTSDAGPEPWLIVTPAGDAAVLADACATALSRAGVRPAVLPVDAATVDRAALARLLSSTPPDGSRSGVLSLLALDTDPHPDHPELARGHAATVTLLQALSDVAAGGSVDHGPLWCVTRGAVRAVAGDTVPSPAQASVWGLAQVTGLEYPDLWGGIIDLPADGEPADLDLLAALLRDPDGENQLAVRSSGGLVRRIAPAPLPGAAGRSWRPRGTVLITGGTGGVGARIARWLAGAGAEHLVLASRRGAAAPGAAELAAQVRDLGADVSLVSCDVGDRDAVADLLAGIPAELPLRAVVHAAAVLDDTVLDRLTARRMASVSRVKAGGAWHLHELTRELELDAFVLFSSVTATFGLPGVANYAPGNAYLEALAEHRRARGLPATAVAWGLWADGGMVEGAAGARLRRHGLIDLRPELATKALQDTLDHDLVTSVLLDVDWDRLAGTLAGGRSTRLLDEIPALRRTLRPAPSGLGTAVAWDAPLALRRTLAEQPEAARLRTLLTVVGTHAAAVLGHASAATIGADTAFRDLGFDSLTAVELRNRLNAAAGTRLATTAVFDHPTPTALARQLGALCGQDLADGSSTPMDETSVTAAVARARAELDRLAPALSALSTFGPESAADRAEIVRRLRGLLAGLSASAVAPATEADSTPDSDDELFDLLDSELETP
ncbi:SDR family NAD(P)-dependent oxidoreductase [Frankia sp. AgPm24]|uniref:SDR family NAD(P)-dependent oxidoreductase n=1 Tax=Frankia sp. AgPm24 TaxID=631128 RepID=UPI0027E2EF45|nr:SDR family NAD(P)-dependent oxidoreductase [Frankia sp. AgPm24]